MSRLDELLKLEREAVAPLPSEKMSSLATAIEAGTKAAATAAAAGAAAEAAGSVGDSVGQAASAAGSALIGKLVVAALVGAVAGSAITYQVVSEQAPPPTREPSSAVVIPPEPVPIDEEPEAPTPEAPVVQPSDPEPTRMRASPMVRTSEPTATPDTPTAPRLANERAMVDAARAALSSAEPTRALEILTRHRSAFPQGALVEEREALRVAALIRAGQVEQGRRTAAAFLRRFPSSLLAPMVRRELADATNAEK